MTIGTGWRNSALSQTTKISYSKYCKASNWVSCFCFYPYTISSHKTQPYDLFKNTNQISFRFWQSLLKTLHLLPTVLRMKFQVLKHEAGFIVLHCLVLAYLLPHFIPLPLDYCVWDLPTIFLNIKNAELLPVSGPLNLCVPSA